MDIKQISLATMAFAATAMGMTAKAQILKQPRSDATAAADHKASYYRHNVYHYSCFHHERFQNERQHMPDDTTQSILMIYRMQDTGAYVAANVIGNTEAPVMTYAHRTAQEEGQKVEINEGRGLLFLALNAKQVNQHGLTDLKTIKRFIHVVTATCRKRADEIKQTASGPALVIQPYKPR